MNELFAQVGNLSYCFVLFSVWAHLGSNQGPTGYEPAALTAELWARAPRVPATCQLVWSTARIAGAHYQVGRNRQHLAQDLRLRSTGAAVYCAR